MQDCLVRYFSLPVSLRVCYSGQPGLAPQCAEVVRGLSGVELLTVIENHYARDIEAGDDVLPNELPYFGSSDRSQCFDFDPLCEVIHGNEQVLVLPCSLKKRP